MLIAANLIVVAIIVGIITGVIVHAVHITDAPGSADLKLAEIPHRPAVHAATRQWATTARRGHAAAEAHLSTSTASARA